MALLMLIYEAVALWRLATHIWLFQSHAAHGTKLMLYHCLISPLFQPHFVIIRMLLKFFFLCLIMAFCGSSFILKSVRLIILMYACRNLGQWPTGWLSGAETDTCVNFDPIPSGETRRLVSLYRKRCVSEITVLPMKYILEYKAF